MDLSLKRKREPQSYTPMKRVYPYRSPESFIPTALSPNSRRDMTRGLTSIMVAAQLGSQAIVQHHIESRGPHLAHFKYGPHNRTLLQLAAKAGSLELVVYLRRKLGVELAARDAGGASALELATSDEIKAFLTKEAAWEAHKGMLFCYTAQVSVLSRLPDEVFRYIIAEGIL